MKIALSSREIVLANSVGERLVFDGVERDWWKFLENHDLVVVPNLVDLTTIDLDVDCVIITGGPDSIARHHTENNLYLYAVSHFIPVLGVCHGAFAVNDLNGGINGQVEGHIGTMHKIEMNGQTYTVNSYHSQSIEKLADNLIPTAVDQDGIVEAFEHPTLPIYGVVWHPERMEDPVLPESVRELLHVS
jgi:gamma-glutamyl-gamma-aminobutyrate hydrolase PuuD